MKEIKAPNYIPPHELNTIFLAGTIDQGNSEDWQARMKDFFADWDVTLLNPRREAWDATWPNDVSFPPFRRQVEWELEALEKAEFRIFVFLENSKSPITLLELGKFLGRPGVVMCPKGFYRRGNVEMVCHRYFMPLTESMEDLFDFLTCRLDPVMRGGA